MKKKINDLELETSLTFTIYISAGSDQIRQVTPLERQQINLIFTLQEDNDEATRLQMFVFTNLNFRYHSKGNYSKVKTGQLWP